MNVIFLDFDGVLVTVHKDKMQDTEKRIIILSEICKKYDCKVVIEASMKDAIDEETMETDSMWLRNVFNLFKKYDIECIGRTPSIVRRKGTSKIEIWKEDEIRLYLYRHPEIDHYCVIDDDDLVHNSDLDKVRPHLVKPLYYSNDPEEEGLLKKHIKEVEKVLKKENEIKKLALIREKRNDRKRKIYTI